MKILKSNQKITASTTLLTTIGYVSNEDGKFDICIVSTSDDDMKLATYDSDNDKYDILQSVDSIEDAYEAANSKFKEQQEFVLCSKQVKASDMFGDDDGFFTRDDEIDYIETELEERIPEITSCRAFIDKNGKGRYLLSVDITTDDWDFTGGGALEVPIDMRKIRKPSDLGKYVDDIVKLYKESISAYDFIADDALNGDGFYY